MAVAKAHGLECEEPIVLADRSNVIVHLPPAPVVARVATTTALVRPDAGAWLKREIAVAGFLAKRLLTYPPCGACRTIYQSGRASCDIVLPLKRG